MHGRAQVGDRKQFTLPRQELEPEQDGNVCPYLIGIKSSGRHFLGGGVSVRSGKRGGHELR